MTSPRDLISSAIAPALRELQDAKLELMGTSTQILRISLAPADDFGFKNVSYSSQTINDCIIQYPMSKIRIAQNRTGTGISTVTNVKAINLAEILPVTLYIKFSGTIPADQVALTEGDIVIDVIKDDQGNKSVIRMEVEKTLGTFMGKNLIGRYFELSLSRKQYSVTIENLITAFVNSFA
jgi:hypothetical protein